MKEGYIGIASITEAQQAAELLRRERLGAAVVRMPQLPGKSGCAFGLRLREAELELAMAVLRKRGIHTGRVLVRERDGSLRERQT